MVRRVMVTTHADLGKKVALHGMEESAEIDHIQPGRQVMKDGSSSSYQKLEYWVFVWYT